MFRIQQKSLFVLCVIFGAASIKFMQKGFERPALQVTTTNGIVQGTRLATKALKSGFYHAYLGIPYAKPPIGSLRFRAPQWANKWNGILDGSREGSGCIEIQARIKSSSQIVGSEDCLYINVFTKQSPKKIKSLRPVMVFIYGGAFYEGNSEFATYGPDKFISKDIILVDFNYRVGPLGFLSTGDLASPGNYGLKDQNMALRWIQKNIKKFGGDPDNVTLFGQSAGSVSVNFHMISPKSRGLFHRSILQSGTVLCHWGSQRTPRNVAALLGVANGITAPKNSEDLVERLRKINIEDLKETLLPHFLLTLGFAPVTGLPYSPSIEPEHDEAFISRDYWYELLKNGEFNRVPVLMGLNSNESLFFGTAYQVAQPLFLAFDIDRSFLASPAMNISDFRTSIEVGNMVAKHYVGLNGTYAKTKIKNILEYSNHEFFARPIIKAAWLMSKHVPLHLYYFSYHGNLGYDSLHIEGRFQNAIGVAHGEELYYLFSKLGISSNNKTDSLIQKRIITLWTNFAKFGNPTPQKEELLNNIIWPRVSRSTDFRMKYLEINESLTIRNTFNEQDHLDWWERLFEKYGKPPFRTH